jgi:uncharacterized membrane protein
MPERQPEQQQTAGLVRKNIQSLLEVRQERERQRTGEQRLADAVTGFIGNMRFVYFLVVLSAIWIGIDLGWLPWIPRFDPFPYPLLSTITSVLALLVSTAVLVTQNRATELADQRAELNVQISLLAEHEVTHLIRLVESIAIRVGAQETADPLLDELKQHVDPLEVIKEIEKAKEKTEPEVHGGDV